MTDAPLPIAILISGSGSNLQALIDASLRDELDCDITVVISDRPDVHGLKRAEAAGIPTAVVAWSEHTSRAEFTEAICRTAEDHSARAMVLAGFMRILAPVAIERFPDAIINLHPALLPAFPGTHAVEMALEYGATLTGVTVHFVDEQVDHGPIIAQEALPVYVDDDADSLHARIRKVEHRLLPEVVAALGRGDLTVEGRHVRWRQISLEETGS